ncbi:MAG: SUMF1/EgtB/PvdO family nonheme iron enzyme [Paludibacteraceae bacterium]|nr:SUMF1/EgtB/PvdO family nonheme iron enzyme [Paludibacteraceae bacterium]
MHKYTLLYIVLCLGGLASLCAKPKSSIPDSLQVLHFEVNGVPFDMQRVEGGVFIMGGTREQHRESISTDLPTHTVALNTYYIGTTEVTQALWKAVMPEWNFLDDFYTPTHPMAYISWYDCQEFIRRLDSITGLPFRLPTESEWEFAARGGNRSLRYRFAGSNIIDSVSWYLNNAGFRQHQVASRWSNELALYDMTGNVSEWCSDWYGRYHLGTEPNPKGPESGEWKVVRGGSYDNCEANLYLSRREYLNPNKTTNYCGLRLALTLLDEPTLQVEEEPTMVRKVKLKNTQVKLVYVACEQPYYISEEPITWRVWDKVMQMEKTEKWSESVIGKTTDEWNHWLERCRKISYQPVDFASESEVATAIAQGVTYEPKVPKQKKRHWERNTRSIQRHRKTTKKAQKWADLIGVTLKEAEDPTLLQYNKEDKNNQPRWIVIR